jgi:L-ribulose-5-phosphate 3-epimerase UlaE
LPASLAEKQRRALENLNREILQVRGLGGEEVKVVRVGEEAKSFQEIAQEIERRTDYGLEQIEIWSKPEEEILDEQRKARARLKSL